MTELDGLWTRKSDVGDFGLSPEELAPFPRE